MIDSQLIQILGLVLIHFIWQGVLIGLLYGCVRFALKGQSAGARYNWAVMSLLLLALTPLLTFAWLLNSPGASAASSLAIMSESLQAGAMSAAAPTGLTLSLLLPWIVGIWLCGVILMTARLGAGWWYVGQLRRRADYAIPQEIQDQLERLARRLNLSGQVGVALSSQIAGPMLVGLLKPLILLPTGMINGLSVRQVEMVLAHELSHLQRADHLVNFFQNIVETLLFYHPVVRWISNEIRAERELVSDEQAARLTGDRVGYAETLLELEKVRGDRLPLAIGMADHQLLTRVRYLLAPGSRQSGSVISGMSVLTVVLISAMTALISTGLQTFSGRVPPEVVSSSFIAESAGEVADDVERLPPQQPREIDSGADLMPYSEVELLSGDSDATLNLPIQANPTPSIQPPAPVAQPRIAQTDPVMDVTPGLVDTHQVAAVLQPVDIEAILPDPDSSKSDEPLKVAALNAPRPAAEIRGGALLDSSVPYYPGMAARRGQEGQAEVRLTVDRAGRVIDAVINKESPDGFGFGEAALQAVEQWRFEPFTRNGQAIRHEIRTGFDFTDPPPCGRVTGTRISRC